MLLEVSGEDHMRVRGQAIKAKYKKASTTYSTLRQELYQLRDLSKDKKAVRKDRTAPPTLRSSECEGR